ncbi:nitrate reductase [Propionivibrio limicola]|uniref:nitrate reductase n=1 Tax=Propionivibrio limicola TaxID=167645 RepID=UPI001292BC28|nr:nitrate reductase [Propionivibrio limicola]
MNAPLTPERFTETRSTCCYCGTGCGVIIQSAGERIVGVAGDPTHPANFGRLCTKGNTLHLAAVRTGRATAPMLRETRGQPRRAVGWEQALDTAAERFAAIIDEHGPDAVGFYVSGQLLTEDYYVFNKLARALIGTNNIDSNSRLCMSSAVAAYKATLGSDAVPCSYEDFDHADLMLITGANPAFAHPILFRRIEAARAANPELKLIVVDPRRTDTAAEADLHLAITPGSDVLLYSAMLNVMLAEGLVDHAFITVHTTGFHALRRQIADSTPQAVAVACGVSSEDIITAARWFGQAKAPLSFWCQGLNQSIHGTANGAALIHLHLATGTIGKPGMGPFSLTGQPNAMGGREAGAMANLLPGHRNLANANDRAELACLWGIPALPVQPGATAVELFDAVHEGRIKAIWIACTNPVQSMPDLDRVREALAKAEFVVVQDAWADTETAALADLLLPAATWGEKEGTVTNSERRISRVRAAVPPPGEARQDWRIARDFALALGGKIGAKAEAEALFAFATSADVYAEHVVTTVGRDLDIGGLSHTALDRLGPQQWPFQANASAGTPRLYADHRFAHADGKARFIALETTLTAEAPDADYPFRLVTGRLRDQWHGMSRTGRIPRLYAHEPEPNVRLHPSDMEKHGWTVDTLLRLSSARNSIVLPVAASEDVRPGQAFVAMHWGRRSLSHDGVNALTVSAFDPISKQPELKHAAVRIEAADLPWRLTALRSAGDGGDAAEIALAWRAKLEPLLGEFAFAALTLDGRERPLVALRIASREPFAADRVEAIASAVDLPEAGNLGYHDRARHVTKRARIDDSRLTGVLLAGEDIAAPWLRAALRDGIAIDVLRRWIFAPRATPPVATAAPRRVVCNCFDVSADAIATEIRAGQTLPQIQEKLKCGTSCGSCLTEVRRMLSASQKH